MHPAGRLGSAVLNPLPPIYYLRPYDAGSSVGNATDLGMATRGGIYCRYPCPVCGRSFGRDERGWLRCEPCRTEPHRGLYIVLYVAGQRHKICAQRGGGKFKGQADAQETYDLICGTLADPEQVFRPEEYRREDQGGFRFEAFATRWLAVRDQQEQAGELAWSTHDTTRIYTELHLVPHLLGIDIRAIDGLVLEELKGKIRTNPKSGQPIGPGTARNIMNTVRRMLKDAHRWGLLRQLPPFPEMRTPAREHHPVTLEEQQRILSAIPLAHQAIFTWLCYQGTRPSETRAIQIQDLQLDGQGGAWIRRTWSRGHLRQRRKGGDELWIPLHPTVLRMLRSWLDGYTRRFGVEPHPTAFLFRTRFHPYYAEPTLRKLWSQACARAGVEHCRPYDGTRHLLATLWASAGASWGVISRLLGHKDEATTRRFYIGIVEDPMRKVLELTPDGGTFPTPSPNEQADAQRP